MAMEVTKKKTKGLALVVAPAGEAPAEGGDEEGGEAPADGGEAAPADEGAAPAEGGTEAAPAEPSE